MVRNLAASVRILVTRLSSLVLSLSNSICSGGGVTAVGGSTGESGVEVEEDGDGGFAFSGSSFGSTFAGSVFTV